MAENGSLFPCPTDLSHLTQNSVVTTKEKTFWSSKDQAEGQNKALSKRPFHLWKQHHPASMFSKSI